MLHAKSLTLQQKIAMTDANGYLLPGLGQAYKGGRVYQLISSSCYIVTSMICYNFLCKLNDWI